MTDDGQATFWGRVAARAAATPAAPMLADQDDRELSFDGFRAAAERAAAGLAALGIGPGDLVAWQLPTTLEAAVLTAALARLGAAQQPLMPILRAREVGSLLGRSRPAAVVTARTWRGFDHEAMVRSVVDPSIAVVALDLSERSGPDLVLPTGDPASLPTPPDGGAADERRWLYHSSGTTSEPKGVWHTDRSLLAGATGMVDRLGFGPDDVYPVAFPIAHIGGAAVLATQLATGCQVLLLDAFDPVAGPELMARHGATVLGTALPFFHAYLAAQERHGAEPLFPRLRTCISGGAAKPPDLHAVVRDRLGGDGLVSSWGLTEFPLATHGALDDPDDLRATTEGTPVPGVALRVVDQRGGEVAPGAEGELRLRGPQCFAGYLDPALDAEAFDEEGWFRTGDLGVVGPLGHVRITGRLKDLVIRNAENISAAEVEGVLATHPAIAEVAVIGVPDPRTGERVCAVVRLGHDVAAVPSLEDLAAHCSAAGLARHKAPEQVEVVEAIPRNAMGKALKAVLRDRFAR